jgi:preprotein translocase subunit Sec63
MVFKINKVRQRERKEVEKFAYLRIHRAYTYLNEEAEKEGWDNFEKVPDKEKIKIEKKVAKEYPFTFGSSWRNK